MTAGLLHTGPVDENHAAAPAARRAASRIALAFAFIAAVTIGGAWFFQLVLDIRPCPLCLEQRYAYYVGIPLALVVAAAATRGVSAWWLRAGFAILLLAMLGNAVLGAYHAGVEWQFWKGPTDCTGPVLDLEQAGDLLSQLDSVKVIRCDEVQWRFLGLSLAGYNVMISFMLTALAAWGFRTARQASARIRPAPL